MSTVSSNIQPPQPVTLCYKRIHKLLPHKHHTYNNNNNNNNNNNADVTPAASPRGASRSLSQQQPSAPPRAAHIRLTPAAYPCPPLYRNKRRLPFVQQQWYAESLRNEHRRHSTALHWDGSDVKEVRADWGWTVGRLTKRIAKVDGVHITRGVTKRGVGGEQDEAGGADEKRVTGEVVGGEEQAGMWNTQSLLIRVDTVVGDEKQPNGTKEREDEEVDEGEDEKQTGPAATVARTPSNDSPLRAARAVYLSPTRQRRVSEEEEEEKENDSASHLQSLTLSPSLRPSPSSSIASTPRLSFSSSETAATAATHTTAPTDSAALENAVLASFNPLPPPFVPSVTTTRDSSSSTRQVKGGESAVLSALRDEFRFGVCGVGVLCRLNVYGYVVWVKDEMDKPQWGQHLRSSGK